MLSDLAYGGSLMRLSTHLWRLFDVGHPGLSSLVEVQLSSRNHFQNSRTNKQSFSRDSFTISFTYLPTHGPSTDFSQPSPRVVESMALDHHSLHNVHSDCHHSAYLDHNDQGPLVHLLHHASAIGHHVSPCSSLSDNSLSTCSQRLDFHPRTNASSVNLN